MRKGISIGQPIINNSVDDNYNPLPDIDAKYGPYSSVKEALETLTPELRSFGPVSYTHLDVYKRQTSYFHS